MMNNTPSGVKKYRESTDQKVARRPKSSSSADGLVQNCVTLSWWFSHKKQHFTLSCVPSMFITLKSHKVLQTSHWRTMASLVMPFSSLGCMHTKYLATKCIIIQHCWIIEIWSGHGQGKALLTRHLNKCLVSDYSANTAYIYWGGLWRQTCCSGMGCKLQLKHTPAAKKSVILNKNKKH